MDITSVLCTRNASKSSITLRREWRKVLTAMFFSCSPLCEGLSDPLRDSGACLPRYGEPPSKAIRHALIRARLSVFNVTQMKRERVMHFVQKKVTNLKRNSDFNFFLWMTVWILEPWAVIIYPGPKYPLLAPWSLWVMSQITQNLNVCSTAY